MSEDPELLKSALRLFIGLIREGWEIDDAQAEVEIVWPEVDVKPYRDAVVRRAAVDEKGKEILQFTIFRRVGLPR